MKGAAYLIVQGKIVFRDAQVSHCTCPEGHKKFDYKSRVPAMDLSVHCPHCGALCLTQQAS